jgi:exodeoxyribonuclease VII small subunit
MRKETANQAGSEAQAEAPAPSFSEAMAELESILARIESEEIDVDDLARELRRASQLLEIARAKIRKAEVEVTQIVQALDSEGE